MKIIYQKRITRLQQKIVQLKLDRLLISNPYNIRYLSGFVGLSPEEREAWMLVLSKKAYLFVNSLYFLQARRKTKHLTVYELTPKLNLTTYFRRLIRLKTRVGFEPHHVTVQEKQVLEEKLSQIQFKPTPLLIESLRQYKDTSEIKNIQKAVQITDRASIFARQKVKPRKTELEVAYEIENFIRTHGGEDIAWRPIIVASGQNSANPHHVTSSKKIRKGEIVLVDMGAKVNGYVSDLTRIFFTAKPSDLQAKVYQAVLAANDKCAKEIQIGMNGKQADHICRSVLTQHGFKKKYQYPHNLGHGIGLQIHEKPSLGILTEDKIENNMVFTIEPAIYIPGRFGIRIEDVVMMKDGKLEVLTQSPKITKL